MPRFFFDVETNAITIDREGAILPDIESARAFAGGLMSVLTTTVDQYAQLCVVIRDAGRIMLEIVSLAS